MTTTVPQPSNPTDTSTRYGALFRRTLSRAVQKSLDEVRAHDYTMPDEARMQAWHMLRLLFEGNEQWDKARQLLIELAPRMEIAGFREEWMEFLEVGIRKSDEAADEISQARLQYYMGQLLRLISRGEQAKEHLLASASIFERLDRQQEQAKPLNELAYLAWQRGNVSETVEYAEKALSLLPNDHIDAAMAYSALGLIAMEQYKYEEKEAFHRQALEIREQHQDDRLIAWSLQNLAAALMHQQRYSEALIEFSRAKKILESIGDFGNQGVVHLNIGLTLHNAGDSLQALEHYATADSILSQVSDVRHLARLNVNRGLSYYTLERFDEAGQCFKRAVALFTTLKNHALRLNATDGVIMTKIALGQVDEAETILTAAMQEVETMPELPNFDYLSNSFANRKRIIEERRE